MGNFLFCSFFFFNVKYFCIMVIILSVFTKSKLINQNWLFELCKMIMHKSILTCLLFPYSSLLSVSFDISMNTMFYLCPSHQTVWAKFEPIKNHALQICDIHWDNRFIEVNKLQGEKESYRCIFDKAWIDFQPSVQTFISC